MFIFFKKKLVVLLFVFPLFLNADTDLVMEITGGILDSSKVKGFTVTSPTQIEVIENDRSTINELMLGLEFPSQYFRTDILIGFGKVENNAFSVDTTKAELDVYYNFGYMDGFAIGPYISYIKFSDLSWNAGAYLDMEETSAVQSGVAFTVGGKCMTFKGYIGKLSGAKIQVKAKNGSTINRSIIDLDGSVFKIGLLFKFQLFE